MHENASQYYFAFFLGVIEQESTTCIQAQLPHLYDTTAALYRGPSRCVGACQHTKLICALHAYISSTLRMVGDRCAFTNEKFRTANIYIYAKNTPTFHPLLKINEQISFRDEAHCVSNCTSFTGINAPLLIFAVLN